MNFFHTLPMESFQAGALLALAAFYGSDAFSRRDRIMGWLALSCLLFSLRHIAAGLEGHGWLPSESFERAQSFLASLGALAMVQMIWNLFREYFPSRFREWVLVGMSLNWIRTLFLPLDDVFARTLHILTMMTYLWTCLVMLHGVGKARRAGHAMARRLLLSLILISLLVFTEILVLIFSDFSLHVSGLAFLILTISLGVSWAWVVTNDLKNRLDESRIRTQAWRGFVPGLTWDTQEENSFLNQHLGPDWPQRLDDHLTGIDGHLYRIHHSYLPDNSCIGWMELEDRTETTESGFLTGWVIALGLEDPKVLESLKNRLLSWGASIQIWGHHLPDSGPWPGLILWDGNIDRIKQWRAHDIGRRRPRWIQIGESTPEEAHGHLKSLEDPVSMRQELERLLVFHQSHS